MMTENTKNDQIFSLITDILKAKPSKNLQIEQFHSLVRNEFEEFCSESVKLKIQDIKTFEKIESDMKLIANCPPVQAKMVGAIGGGFSSGKSSFINSFMTDDTIKLATGIIPVTAIPSYVICGDTPSITGVSYRGGTFTIENAMYKDISHQLLKQLNFDLKEILQYITVDTKLDSEYFDNICLIDTPGYNAPSAGTTDRDKEIALSYIKDAKFLIWLIGLDSKGTINSEDLTFLKEMSFGFDEAKSLYIVANKASLISPSNREQILNNLIEILDDEGISYDGINLYDSKKKEEYLYEGKTIKEFLLSQNIPTQKYVELALPLKKVFERYEDEAIKKYESDKNYQNKIKKIILDGFESKTISITSNAQSSLEEGLNELKNYLRPGDLPTTLKKINDMRSKFFACLDTFCDVMKIEKVLLPVEENKVSINSPEALNPQKKKFCDKCGIKLSPADNFCPKCGRTTRL